MHLEINPSKSPRFMWVWMNFEILLVSPWTCHFAWQIFDPMSNTVQLLSYIWPRAHTWSLPYFPQAWCAILFTNIYHFPTNKMYSFCFHSDNLPPDRICSMWCSKQKSGMHMPSQIWCWADDREQKNSRVASLAKTSFVVSFYKCDVQSLQWC